MELRDTIQDMTSPDYKRRFVAEYRQVSIRHERLGNMLEKYDNKELDFEPTCPIILLRDQYNLLEEYKAILEIRAIAEDIDLFS